MSDEIVRRTEHTLLGTDDPTVWAHEFCRIFNGAVVVVGEQDASGLVDESTMIGWFANAMQTAINMLPDMAEDEEEEPLDLGVFEEKFIEGFQEGRPDG